MGIKSVRVHTRSYIIANKFGSDFKVGRSTAISIPITLKWIEKNPAGALWMGSSLLMLVIVQGVPDRLNDRINHTFIEMH